MMRLVLVEGPASDAGETCARADRLSGRDAEPFALSGQGEAAVERVECPPLRMPLGPVKRRAQLEGVEGAQRMEPE